MNIVNKIDSYLNEEGLFDDVDKAIEEIQKGIKVPFLQVSKSALGKFASISIKISLDKKENWPGNIYQNSRYSQFFLNGNVLEQVTMDHGLKKKFRKAKVKALKDVVTKINKYISEIS
jgi:putative lipoic acid-binding regulatory protein